MVKPDEVGMDTNALDQMNAKVQALVDQGKHHCPYYYYYSRSSNW